MGFDWTINLADGIKRIDGKKTVPGNMEPYLLFGSDAVIKKRVQEIVVEGKDAPAPSSASVAG
ncbi:MAG: hypothetical protein NT096_09685 [Proteobacteria bacterium]|nr:hypothetical protein [Pseudomonadota bacterium]